MSDIDDDGDGGIGGSSGGSNIGGTYCKIHIPQLRNFIALSTDLKSKFIVKFQHLSFGK